MKVRFGRNTKSNKHLAPSLNLTALIDAFSILIIFMIFTMANGDYEAADGIKLAEVAQAQNIEKNPVITITATEYLFNKQKVNFAQLRSLVLSQKPLFASHKAVVEADQGTPYSQIQPVMALLSELEVETIQLAVASQENL